MSEDEDVIDVLEDFEGLEQISTSGKDVLQQNSFDLELLDAHKSSFIANDRHQKVKEIPADSTPNANLIVDGQKALEFSDMQAGLKIATRSKNRWTAAEDLALSIGLDTFGYGSWTLISKYMKTRTSRQVKNRARHIMHIMEPADDFGKFLVDKMRQSFSKRYGGDSDCDAAEDNFSLNFPAAAASSAEEEDLDVLDGTFNPISPACFSGDLVKKEAAANQEAAEGHFINESSISPEANETMKNLTETSEQSVVFHEQPSFINLHEISEAEKSNLPEFFMNRGRKTPERYLFIRNHIINKWNEVKPAYLTKISAREGLKNCGDVNAIGRVHSYLELNGIINSGHKIFISFKQESDKKRLHFRLDPFLSSGPRQRKVRDPEGNWVDSKDLEGKTIDHQLLNASDDELQNRRSFGKRQRLKERPTYIKEETEIENEEFNLVPVSAFMDHFKVEVNAAVLALVDVHSRIIHNEVIGLLGGSYEGEVLRILKAVPCKSHGSTQTMCEMDPVSEIEALDKISEEGLSLVGWYHSHPTFEAIPSVRDIMNQLAYQEMFRREEDGRMPFIGVIASPYWKSQTQFGFFWMESDGVPLACRTEIIESRYSETQVEFFQNAAKLIEESLKEPLTEKDVHLDTEKMEQMRLSIGRFLDEKVVGFVIERLGAK